MKPSIQFWIALWTALCCLNTTLQTQAQVVPDATLPNNSNVTPQDGNSSIITGGTVAGSNLFHSFREFSVPTGDTAYFNNASEIQNIISRVTGSSISNIDGLLKANGSANLFLLNPNGIIFGPNARLDIGGSFVSSTASSLKFADGNQFSATAPQTTPLLTVSVPLGLQFGPTAGSIVNRSKATNISGEPVGLQVQPGKTLALVGGNVRLEGATMLAPGGRVELGGVSGSGTVEFGDSNNLRLSFPDGVARADVALTEGSFVSVAAGGGGDIAINARNIDILEGSYLFAGIDYGLGSGTAVAGDVTLNATGAIVLKQSSNIVNEVSPNATGNSGNIDIKAESLNLENAFLSTSTFGQGNAGSININARDVVSFAGSTAYSQVESEAVGNSGGIDITTGSLALTNSALLAHTFGQGNAGTININARDRISFDNKSVALSEVRRKEAIGNSGGINITTGSLFLTNRAVLATSTFGQGNGGTININARDVVSFAGSTAYSQVEREAVGNSGGINITAGSLSFTNGAVLRANTKGKGDAGDVNILARDAVSFDGVGSNRVSSAAFSQVEKEAKGNSGNINITTGSLSVKNGARLATSTFGQGNAGSVNIDARDIVTFDGVGSNELSSGVLSSVEADVIGNGGNISRKGGDINIKTGLLFVTDGAQLIARTLGRGDAGNVNINAHDTISFNGVSSNKLSSAAFTTVDPNAVGKGGDINIFTGSLSVKNGALLAASTFGQGDAGSVSISAGSTVFDGVGSNGFPSAAASTVESRAVGNGLGINITTRSLSLANGAQLTASTSGQGNGGNITINANTLSATGGGQVLTTSRSDGEAGNITLNVTDSVTLAGSDRNYFARPIPDPQYREIVVGGASPNSGLFANTSETSTNRGGDLNINTGELIVREGAEVNVSSEGRRNAGNLDIKANVIRLENQGKLTASTAAGTGGNITLSDLSLLLMRSGSLISAEALNDANGGNITINAKDGFIVAVPKENSDIVAKAAQGRGGQIQIQATGIYGFENYDRNLGDRYFSNISDINASSEAGSQLDGTVELNTPEIDPNTALINLPTVPVDTELAQGCNSPNYAQSSFIITGRGGLPPNPKEVLTPDAVEVDWVTLNPNIDNGKSPSVSTPTNPTPEPIVEATGWVFNAKGQVVFTADAPTSPRSSWNKSAECRS